MLVFLAQRLSSSKTRIKTFVVERVEERERFAQKLSSSKTRIKTVRSL